MKIVKLPLHPAQKRIALICAQHIYHSQPITIAIPIGYGKAIIMTEVARLLRKKNNNWAFKTTK